MDKREDDQQLSGNRPTPGKIIDISITLLICVIFLFILLLIRKICWCYLFTLLKRIRTIPDGVDADIPDIESIRTK